MVKLRVEPPRYQVRENLEQGSPDDGLERQSAVSFKPAVPALNAQVAVGREDAVRCKLLHPMQDRVVATVGRMRHGLTYDASCLSSHSLISNKRRSSEVTPSTITR